MASKMSEEPKGRKRRRSFTKEYKAQVVVLCGQEGRTPHSVARELGLTPTAVRAWVQQAKVDGGGGGTGTLTTQEREELSQLRREVRTLRQERDILRKATAFFAKEGTS